MDVDLMVLSEAEIVGLTLIGESRGEPIQGQVAVGCVIRNRFLHNPIKYVTYHHVVLEKLQFSCWNETDGNRSLLIECAEKLIVGQKLTDPYLLQCMYIARGVLSFDILDNTRGAVNYLSYGLYHSDMRPSWAKNAKNVMTIANQVFFSV